MINRKIVELSSPLVRVSPVGTRVEEPRLLGSFARKSSDSIKGDHIVFRFCVFINFLPVSAEFSNQ